MFYSKYNDNAGISLSRKKRTELCSISSNIETENTYVDIMSAAETGKYELAMHHLSSYENHKMKWVLWSIKKKNVGFFKELILSINNFQEEKVDSGTILHYAVKVGAFEIVKAILDMTTSNSYVNIQNSSMETPLHVAAMEGHFEIVKLLLNREANPLIKDKCRNIPLHLAARKGCERSCEEITLLSNSLEQKFSRNVNKDTPLIVAARNGNKNCCKYLLCDEIINLYNKDKDTALHCSAKKGLYSTVECLIDLAADTRITNKLGNIPVFDTIGLQSSRTFQIMFEKDKNFLTNECDVFFGERTLLHMIAMKNSVECLNYLLDDKEATQLLERTKNIQDKDGNTPLHLALTKKNVEIAEKLIEMGCSFDEINNKKQTAIHIAAKNNLGSICTIIGSKPKFRFMVNNCDEDGSNILHLGAAAKNIECCKLAIKKGIHIGVADKNGKTALHLAAEVGDPRICKLFNHKSLLQTEDDNNDRPLHLAAKNGHLECVKIVYKAAKTILFLPNRNKKNPLNIAFESKNDAIFNYLLQNISIIPENENKMSRALSETLHSYMHQAIYDRRRLV